MMRSVEVEQPDVLARLGAEIGADIAEGRLTLPVLPNVAAEVMASSVDERADAARLAVLIQQDQSLASYLLRVSNSAAFRGSIEIVSLQQAIARLGMARIREIALSASLKGSLFREGPHPELVDQLWRQALAAALWTKEVARAARRSVELGYLCGLLHRLGAPLVLQQLGIRRPGLDAAAAIALVDRHQRAAGVALAWTWALPLPVCAAIEHLTDPAAAGRHAELVAATACGARLSRADGSRDEALAALLALPGAHLLDLYPEDYAALLDRQADIDAAVASMVL
ncbi:MAG: HDOD domain-containing protein [Pseudomonadales bacterium]